MSPHLDSRWYARAFTFSSLLNFFLLPSLSPSLLPSSLSPRFRRLWSVCPGQEEEGKVLRVFEGHAARLASCAFHPSGRYLGTTSWDYTWRWVCHGAPSLSPSPDLYLTACHPISRPPLGSGPREGAVHRVVIPYILTVFFFFFYPPCPPSLPSPLVPLPGSGTWRRAKNCFCKTGTIRRPTPSPSR